jgi:hypothetical protein
LGGGDRMDGIQFIDVALSLGARLRWSAAHH